jgi:hypothetical protein
MSVAMVGHRFFPEHEELPGESLLNLNGAQSEGVRDHGH